MKNKDNNIINDIINDNDVPVAGTDLFADSEDFLNELTDSELVQVRGGFELGPIGATEYQSNISLICLH